jgi:hypothetical protein
MLYYMQSGKGAVFRRFHDIPWMFRLSFTSAGLPHRFPRDHGYTKIPACGPSQQKQRSLTGTSNPISSGSPQAVSTLF